MKKTIRLTESDLTRIVKRVVKENDEYKDRSMYDPHYGDDNEDFEESYGDLTLEEEIDYIDRKLDYLMDTIDNYVDDLIELNNEIAKRDDIPNDIKQDFRSRINNFFDDLKNA